MLLNFANKISKKRSNNELLREFVKILFNTNQCRFVKAIHLELTRFSATTEIDLIKDYGYTRLVDIQ